MRPNPLDDPSVNRLLAGAVRPEDAPPGYAGVADLLAEARPQPASAELPREAAMVAAMQAAISSQPAPLTTSPRRTVLKKILTAKVAAATAAIMLTASGAAAATGSLPGAAQDVASTALAKVGISVPGHDDHAGTHPDSRGKSADHATNSSTHDNGTTSDDSTTHTTGPNEHAQFGQCTAQAASDGHPNANSPVSSADCTNVTHPGNGGSNDKGNKPEDPGSQGEDHTPSSTPGGPPASTPGDDHAGVTTPNHGAASDGHGNDTSTTEDHSSSSGSGTSSGSGNSGDHGRP